MIKKNIKMNKGLSIIETLFYVVLFSMLSILAINAMLTMMKSFKTTAIERSLSQSNTIMEAMSREIKKANSLSLTSSSDLVLGSKDDSGNAKTIEFKLIGSNLVFNDTTASGGTFGNLNAPNVSVTGLTFTQIVTTKGKAVKIVLSIRANEDILGRTENFYDTVVLRGDY